MRVLVSFLLILFSTCVSAQSVFTKKVVTDKFADIIEEKEQKTLITVSDSTVIVEEKGHEPELYLRAGVVIGSKPKSMGSKEELVEVANGVYGFETSETIAKRVDGKIQYYELLHRFVSKYKFTYEFEAELYFFTEYINNERTSQAKTIYQK